MNTIYLYSLVVKGVNEMEKTKYILKEGLGKKLIILGLYITSMAIIFSGVFFSAYSVINHIFFRVLNANVSGMVFGLTVFYLGVRYFINVSTLKEDMSSPDAKFSWSNFKKKKSNKISL